MKERIHGREVRAQNLADEWVSRTFGGDMRDGLPIASPARVIESLAAEILRFAIDEIDRHDREYGR